MIRNELEKDAIAGRFPVAELHVGERDGDDAFVGEEIDRVLRLILREPKHLPPVTIISLEDLAPELAAVADNAIGPRIAHADTNRRGRSAR